MWNRVVLCLVAQSCPTLCDPMDCRPPGSSVHGDSPGKNTGVASLSLLQGIFPTQGLNPGFPHHGKILHCLSHQGSPRILEWVAYPFSRGTSWPRNWNTVASSSSRLTLACVLRAPAPGGHCGLGLCPCFPGQELPMGSLFPSRESNSRCCHGSSKSSPAGKSPVFWTLKNRSSCEKSVSVCRIARCLNSRQTSLLPCEHACLCVLSGTVSSVLSTHRVSCAVGAELTPGSGEFSRWQLRSWRRPGVKMGTLAGWTGVLPGQRQGAGPWSL